MNLRVCWNSISSHPPTHLKCVKIPNYIKLCEAQIGCARKDSRDIPEGKLDICHMKCYQKNGVLWDDDFGRHIFVKFINFYIHHIEGKSYFYNSQLNPVRATLSSCQLQFSIGTQKYMNFQFLLNFNFLIHQGYVYIASVVRCHFAICTTSDLFGESRLLSWHTRAPFGPLARLNALERRLLTPQSSRSLLDWIRYVVRTVAYCIE